MQRQGDEIHIETDEARAGENSHAGRYVLAISLILAILALSTVWITGALKTPQAAVSAPLRNQPAPAR